MNVSAISNLVKNQRRVLLASVAAVGLTTSTLAATNAQKLVEHVDEKQTEQVECKKNTLPMYIGTLALLGIGLGVGYWNLKKEEKEKEIF